MSDGKHSRRQVIKAAAGSAVALALPAIGSAQGQAKPPSLPAELVKQFVIVGHGDFPKVKEMLAAEPGLLNACWDWGGGDFETALEGAGHMGNKEIARFLISQGARMNIFQAAMLGELGIVRALIEAHPEIAKSKGPHGILLMTHAEKGGPEAAAVVEYLKSRA